MKSNKTKINFWLLLGIILPLVLVVLYFGIIQNLVVLAYENKSPLWFNTLIDYFYPRFWVEKNRFSQEFFLSKTTQIVLRFTLVAWAISFCMILRLKNQKFKNRNIQFWNAETSIKQITIVKYAFVVIIGLFTWDWLFIFSNLVKASAFYEPVFLLKILSLPFPNETVVYLLIILMWSLAISLLLPFQKLQVIFSSILAILFLILQGYLYSFHKLDHTFATFTYVLLILPFMLYEQNKAKKQNFNMQNAWALQLAKVMICIAYFLTGFEKMLISGFTWFAPYNLEYHVKIHQSDFGLWISQSNIISSILLIWVVIWELGFPLLLFFPKLKFPILIAGVLFHLATFFLFGVGGWYSPWWLVYVVFLVKVDTNLCSNSQKDLKTQGL